MRSLLPEQRGVNGHDLIEGAIAETHRQVLRQMGQGIARRLHAAAEHVLGRAPCVRRGHAADSLEQTYACPRCHTVQSQRFSRNGSRIRHPVTRWGEVPFSTACEALTALPWRRLQEPGLRHPRLNSRGPQHSSGRRLCVRSLA
jgi:hypothetical protein